MLVSVITPTYNQSGTLPRAARSVFAQTYDPIEYVIIDDGSTDDTERVVDRFDYPGLRYVKLDENHGVGTARNEGIEAANGRFVLFVDADDELRRSAVSTLVNALHAAPETCAGVFGQYLLHRDTGEEIRSTYDRSEVRYEDLIEENHMGAFGGKLLRRRLFDEIGPIDTAFPASEDFDFFMRAVASGHHFKYVDELVYDRHQHPGQLSGNTYEKLAGMKKILEKYGDDLTPRHRAYRMYVIGHIYAKNGRMTEAGDWFRGCIFLCPFRPKYYIRFFMAKSRLYNYASASKGFVRGLIG